VIGNLSALSADHALLAAFDGTGNPDTDYPAFKNTFAREAQSYRAAAQADSRVAGPAMAVAAAGPAATGASSATAGLPASVFANLPAAMQEKLLAATGNKPAAGLPAAVVSA
jgi:hypothetical protein